MDATGVLLVHGGAGMLAAAARRRACLASVRGALEAGAALLGESAELAVVAAVARMESDGVLNAGRGGTRDERGLVTLDAGFMEGRRRRFGAVGCVTRTHNPILLAHVLAKRGPFGCLLVGAEADALCERAGLDADDLTHVGAGAKPQQRGGRRGDSFARARSGANRRSEAADTVGAVALDLRGRLAAAVSTGGLFGKPAGRVGDSAVVGAGFWAEASLGACVTTGIGEAMLREGTARRAVRLLGGGTSPADAARIALGELRDRWASPHAGLVLVTADGRVAIDHTSDFMPAGVMRTGERARTRSSWRTSEAKRGPR